MIEFLIFWLIGFLVTYTSVYKPLYMYVYDKVKLDKPDLDKLPYVVSTLIATFVIWFAIVLKAAIELEDFKEELYFAMRESLDNDDE